MTKEKIQQLFKKIGQVKVEYYKTDYGVDKITRTIKEHVDRQVKEHLIEAKDKQKNTNFVIALVYDQASNDNRTQIARIHYRDTDLIQQLRENPNFLLDVNGVRLDQSRKIEQIKEFLNDQKINSIVDYISNNNIESVKREIDDIYGVGAKLTGWSITNVVGSEYVIDSHIARVLVRTGIVTNVSLKPEKLAKIKDGAAPPLTPRQYVCLQNEFKTQVGDIKISSQYKGFQGFKATQYLWFFGRNVCTKTQPRCNDCVLNELCRSNPTKARKPH